MTNWSSESGHWYDAKTGEPRYTIVGANGQERPSTLRDAKKYGWVPSVTTIMAQVRKHALEKWQQKQLLLAARTMPSIDFETDDNWLKRVYEDSRAEAKAAADRGTEIHAAIECFFARRPYDEFAGKGLLPWVKSISNLIEQTFGEQEWRPEKSFAHPIGYGGKVDLHSDSVLIDFKGKDGRTNMQLFDEHAMQLAAYSIGLRGTDPAASFYDGTIRVKGGYPRAGIIFFDRTEPYCEYHEIRPERLERGWLQFEALLKYWKATNLDLETCGREWAYKWRT